MLGEQRDGVEGRGEWKKERKKEIKMRRRIIAKGLGWAIAGEVVMMSSGAKYG